MVPADNAGMTTTWQRFADEAPEFAATVAERFTAAKHHVLATLRADGSPRVSGTEVDFHGPDLIIGSMLHAVKARDLLRDPRFALHAAPDDDARDDWADVKVSGRAFEVVDPVALREYVEAAHPPEPFHLFRLELGEAVVTTLGPERDHMVLRTWRPGEPLLEYARYATEPPRRSGSTAAG